MFWKDEGNCDQVKMCLGVMALVVSYSSMRNQVTFERRSCVILFILECVYEDMFQVWDPNY